MAYWVKRIILKSGETVTEHELRADENLFAGTPLFVGQEITVSCRGRSFKARVIWGFWPKDLDKYDSETLVPLRVEAIE